MVNLNEWIIRECCLREPGPSAAFLNALEAPRLLFDPAFAPAEGAFSKVAAEACIAAMKQMSWKQHCCYPP
jgi:hypothetical protein